MLYAIIALCCIIWLSTSNKFDIHLRINSLVGEKIIDFFFYYITYLGDGRVAVVILLLLLVYNLRLGIAATLSFLSAGLIANILKYFFFDHINRPFFYSSYRHMNFKVVEGVDIHIHNSFPSGHATQAFALFFLLALNAKKQTTKLVWLLLACITAFSRMYLSQHWLPDVLAGSFIGVVFSCLYFYLFISRNTLPKLNATPFAFINGAR